MRSGRYRVENGYMEREELWVREKKWWGSGGEWWVEEEGVVGDGGKDWGRWSGRDRMG
jgi:hypothetical protein